MIHSNHLRIYLNIDKWHPTSDEFLNLLDLVPEIEQERILKFRRPHPTQKAVWITGEQNSNAKSSLIGLLMARYGANKCLGLQPSTFKTSFSRTKQGKPYLAHHSKTNFNFNISHSDSFVIFGCEPNDLIGVDVMRTTIPRAVTNQDREEFFETMTNCFTSSEWNQILSSSEMSIREESFFRHWTMKEAYIKCIGLGLGFELLRVQLDAHLDAQGRYHWGAPPSPSPLRLLVDQKEVPCALTLEKIEEHAFATCVLPAQCAALDFSPTLAVAAEDLVDAHPPRPWVEMKLSDLLF